MKALNRIMVLIIIAAMSLMMMTACGSNASAEQSDVAATETVEQTTAVEETTAVQDDIGAEKVKEIVLAKVPGTVEGNIYEFERDYDDGRVEYEGSIYHDGYEYEFEVDGATGNILKWEIDD